jgi:phenylalanyl-tRNA synthetase beta chain
MKFSEKWLRELVDPAIGTGALADLLTMAGHEVEGCDPAAPAFTGVVVGRVLAVERHPKADRLTVCQVDVGAAAPLSIVCGAPNVRAGMVVPCAVLGARLPTMQIRAAKVRGIESQGMLCAADELGLSEDHSGLLELPAQAPVGRDVRDVLELDDHVFTLKITPNRGDAMSVLGIAREVHAYTGTRLAVPAMVAVPAEVPDLQPVRIEAADLCGRFSGRIVRDVNAAATTPEWMRRRLERSGQRPISALVDISNYVMLELGRPSHVFDLDKVRGPLVVRWARDGERLDLLNGQTVDVDGSVGVICDDAGPEAMAGIMGGAATAVSPGTRNVYVEAAFWWPDAIAGRARRYNFSTDAAQRFERGVDYETTVAHIERITALMLEICGGRPGPVDDNVVRLPERKPVRLRMARADSVIGVAIGRDDMRGIFARLGFRSEDIPDGFAVTAPAPRFDVEIEEDLIEELARVHGYDRIAPSLPVARTSMRPRSEGRRQIGGLRRALVARDFHEVVTYSFVEAGWERDLAGNDRPIELANPIASQMSVMRTTLFGGLLDCLRANLAHRLPRVRIFEVGRCFVRSGDTIDQPVRVAGLCFGEPVPEQWGHRPARPVDFFDVKADLEAVAAGRVLRCEPTVHPALHPGRSARVFLDGAFAGFLGELHPEWQAQFEIPVAPILFELDLDRVLDGTIPAYRPISRFPIVRRDLSLEVPQGVPVGALMASLEVARTPVVTDVALFDLYRGKGVEEGRKSLAFRVLLQDTQKTLTDVEVDEAVGRLVKVLQEEHNARLRK